MAFAPKARGDLEDCCLPGTREEIIQIIVGWASGADPYPHDEFAKGPKPPESSARILWLCGVAGSGKSQIARSVSSQLREAGRLGSLYCCSDKHKASLHPGNLFSTIARDLSYHDPLRKRALVKKIGEDKALWTSENCREQFQQFIVEPSRGLTPVGDTIIVIDAFDEIGDAAERAQVLFILTERANDLPTGLRILVTSRFEPDIQDALQPLRAQVNCIQMDDIPKEDTSRDIQTYVEKKLKVDNRKPHDVDQLVQAAGTSFQWASTACLYINDRNDGDGTLSRRDRFEAVINSGDGLDNLYTRILDQHFSNSRDLDKLLRVLADIICVEEPLSLKTLASLNAHRFNNSVDRAQSAYKQIVEQLASLLVNTHDLEKPISPFHTSFADFLRTENRSRRYHINAEKANRGLAFDCADVMKRDLEYDICRVPTSFKATRDLDRDSLTQNISSHLRYACHFWARHFSRLQFLDEDAQQMLIAVLQEHFLEWLEVMSLTQVSFQAPLALLEPPVVRLYICTLWLDALLILEIFKGELATLLHEMRQFALHFAVPIRESVPHIYLSALAFAPTSSSFHSIYQRYRGMVVLKRGRSSKWSSLIHVFNGHTDDVSSVAFSRDGSRIASGSEDATIRLWNVETGAAVGSPLIGHHGPVDSVTFSPDGTKIASSSADGTVRVWNVEDMETGVVVGEVLRRYLGHYGATSVAFSPDGARIASSASYGRIEVHNLATIGRTGPLHMTHCLGATSIAFFPDGTRIVSGSIDLTIQVWDAKTGAAIIELLTGHTGRITSVAISCDGTRIVSGSHDKTIRVWDVKTWDAIGQPLMGHTREVGSVAFSPDGSKIVSGSFDNTARVWDVETGEQVCEPHMGHSNIVHSTAFSPDGTQVVSASRDNTIRLWKVETRSAVREQQAGHTGGVVSVAFSPSGSLIVSGSLDHTIRVWSAETGGAVGTPLIGHEGEVYSVAVSPDGSRIVSGSVDTTIRVWSVETCAMIGEPLTGHTDVVRSIAVSSDSTRIVSGSWDYTIRMWNMTTHTAINMPPMRHRRQVQSVVFSPDGTKIVSGDRDGTIRVWNTANGATIHELREAHDHFILSVAFSPDSALIVSGSWDRTIRVWDAKTGAAFGEPLVGHTDGVNSVLFSPEGNRIVSGAEDKTLRLWDVRTGGAIGEPLVGHTGGIWSAAFSPDGTSIVSGSWDSTVRVWNVKTAAAVGERSKNFLTSLDSFILSR